MGLKFEIKGVSVVKFRRIISEIGKKYLVKEQKTILKDLVLYKVYQDGIDYPVVITQKINNSESEVYITIPRGESDSINLKHKNNLKYLYLYVVTEFKKHD